MPKESSHSPEGPRHPIVSPELTKWLRAHPEVNARSVLELPHIPILLGGPKSGKFLIKEPGASPDTPPNPNATIDLKNIAVPAHSLGGFADSFDAMEAQANAQYPHALYWAQHEIGERQAGRVAIDSLFIPDTVNHTAHGYFRRLGRLAQDTGIGVVIPTQDHDYGEVFTGFKRFEPARAPSVQTYWATRAERVTPFARKIIPPEPHDREAITAILSLTPQPKDSHTQADYDLSSNLQTIECANDQKLQRWLLQRGNQTSKMLPILKELGYGSSYVPDYNRASARMVLAKINDPDGLVSLKKALQEKNNGYGSHKEFMEPLGIYLKNNPELLAETMQQVESRIQQAKKDDGGELIHLMGALYYTQDLRVGDFLSKYLEVPPTAGKHYGREVLFATLRWLPDYTDIVQDMPDSPQKRKTLAVIERRVAQFLHNLTTGQLKRVGAIDFGYGSYDAANMLLKFGNPAHKGLLRHHMLQLFEETGSVLEPTRSVDDDTFARQYLQYRRLYGDLPEISRLIRTPYKSR